MSKDKLTQEEAQRLAELETQTPAKAKNNAVAKKPTTASGMLNLPAYKQRFKELLDKNSEGFITSVISLSKSNALKDCDPNLLIGEALKAAVLKLPIEPGLGMAYILPFKSQGKTIPTFVLGYKGLIQLALRSGQYRSLNTLVVYESQFISFNPLTEDLQLNFDVAPDGEVVGYCATFELINGFRKTIFWKKQRVLEHGQTYSPGYDSRTKTFSKYTIWGKDFDAAGLKTVLIQLLSKWGPKSIDYQNAPVNEALKADPDFGHSYEDEAELQTYEEV